MSNDRNGTPISIGADYVLAGQAVADVDGRVILDTVRPRIMDSGGSGVPKLAPAAGELIARSSLQAADALLTAIAALTTAANKLAYFTGVDTVALTDFTAAARTFVAAVDAAAQRTALGLGALATKTTVATADIDADAVTYAKMQNVSATDKVLGRSTAGAGDVEEIACTAAGRALIDDADAAAQRTTLGLGTAATRNMGVGGSDLIDLGTMATTFQVLDADLTAIAALSPSNGALLLRSGGAWTALAPGTEGQHLVANASGIPEWQTP